MKTVLLIDGDEYLFKAAIAVQRVIKWDEQNHVLYANENEAYDNFLRMVRQTEERLGAIPGSSVLCFGGERPYFREDIYPAYKADRGTKPICYAAVKERLTAEFLCKSYPHIEADDCLGILGTKPSFGEIAGGAPSMRHIMCSQDKDLLTVPGWHYDGKGDAATYHHPMEAERYHFLQTLVGDRTDNYPGCPGYGEKRGEDWLASDDPDLPGDLWSWRRVVAAYERKGLAEYDALTQARLARILQWSDWDYDTKTPILWNPHCV